MNKDINQRYNGKLHGYWECYFCNTNRLYFKMYYINDKVVGYNEVYLVYDDYVILNFNL